MSELGLVGLGVAGVCVCERGGGRAVDRVDRPWTVPWTFPWTVVF